MLLLRFAFENHRSFRDESDLTLVQPRLKTARPLDGTWLGYTNRVAAIYGSNASGKSGVLEAMAFMRDVILNSAGAWSQNKRLPRIPFALDGHSRKEPSTFAVDFALADIRYEYGFSLSEESITGEWLYTYPTGRKRVLFERGEEPSELTFGRDLRGGDSTLRRITGKRELVLSKGASLRNEQLEAIYLALTGHLVVARFSEFDREERLRRVVEDIADGTLSLHDLEIMLKVADVGITGAEVAEEEAPPNARRVLRALLKAERADPAVDNALNLRPESQGEPLFELDDEEIDRFIADAAHSLKFRHVGQDEKTYQLASSEQSTGTLSWLSLAAPALRMLRIGGVLAVDELDSSLHPQLSQVMIQMFRDDRLNPNGSQLIFTTHDTFFMSPASDVELRPDEIWLAQKGRDGASELFSIADFPTRKDDNLARRYLQGRYGAIPSVAPSFLAALAPWAGEGIADGAALP
jgi:AAA15 family ATPase/GTPase